MMLASILHNLFQKAEDERSLPNFFYEANVTLLPKQNEDSILKNKAKDQYPL